VNKKRNRYVPATVNIAERMSRFIPSGISTHKVAKFSKGGQIVAVSQQAARKPTKVQPVKEAKPVRPENPQTAPHPKVLKKTEQPRPKVKSVSNQAKNLNVKKRTILPYDGPQRFAGGFRIAQGGLFELGRR
jgi:hypothetical protein